MNKKLIPILIFVAGALAGFGGYYFSQTDKVISSQKAGTIAMDFINKSVAEQNVTAEMLSIIKESGVYKIRLKIQEQEYDSFITTDGKYLFSSAFVMEPEKIQAPEQGSEANLESFAKCISDSGAKFYGAFWCSHCNNQKDMFGDSAQYLPYIECSTEDGSGQLGICKDQKITGYPTWEFADASRESGEVPLEKLAEKTNCQLPENN